MTDKEILQKALDKAIENGWTGYTIGGADKVTNAFVLSEEAKLLKIALHWTCDGDETNYTTQELAGYIILLQSFAKAFWGEDLEEGPLWKIYQPPKAGDLVVYVGTYVLKWGEEAEPTVGFVQADLPAWQHHLQQMVLEENPIKYLEQFL